MNLSISILRRRHSNEFPATEAGKSRSQIPEAKKNQEKKIQHGKRNFILFALIFSPIWFLVSGPWFLATYAQELATPSCLAETEERLAAAARQFRAVVLGQRRAADLPNGAVRYDRTGNAWRKTAAGWRTLGAGFQGTTWSNTLMDSQAEFAPRKGILETKKRMTSELIPDMLQAVRAFQCQTRAICGAAGESLGRDAPGAISVQPIGCIAFTIPRLNACRIEQPPAPGATDAPAPANIGDVTLGHCDRIRTQLVERETQLLSLLVSYDVAYRSLLQFAGAFDDFVRAFREPIAAPFLQSLRILRTFSDKTCFTAQCDE